jgi:flagellar protein FliO/FliZ
LVRHGKLEHLLLIGGGSDAVIERSMIGGIPLAARMQASKAQEKQEDESYSRPADRFRTSNRFSSALLRSKAAEETSERSSSLSRSSETPQSDTTQKPATAGAAAATAGVATASSRPATPVPPTSSKTTEARPSFARRQQKSSRLNQHHRCKMMNAPPLIALWTMPYRHRCSMTCLLAAAPAVEPPKPDPLAPKTPVKDSLPPAEPFPAAPSSTVDDLSLERELEAALELDAFERTPSAGDSDHAPIDLPPLDDLPDLPDLSTLTGNGNEAPAEPKEAIEKTDKPASKEPEGEDKPDPLKLSSVREAAPATPSTTNDKPPSAVQDVKSDDQPAEKTPPAPDIPVALSGRDDPPIPVAIPSRGPAANATTLAKADDEKTTAAPETSGDDAVDISSMLQPSGGGKADGEPKGGKSDDLDDEMRRLLGEIAGDPEQK